MKEQQNVRPLAPVEDFEQVKQELLQKLRLWRTTVIAGAAVAALVPAAVFADAELTGNTGGGIPQQVQSLLATVTTNSSQIAALQGSDASQNAQIAQLQQQLQAQSAAIAALQVQLKDETAARQAGEATGKAYTDTEMTRASAAESGIHDALTAEIAARKQGDSDTLAASTLHTNTAVAAETTRATAAEGTLTSLLSNEIARATAAEQAAILTAVGNVEANLTAMAKSPFGGNPAGPQAFWDQIQQGLFG